MKKPTKFRTRAKDEATLTLTWKHVWNYERAPRDLGEPSKRTFPAVAESTDDDLYYYENANWDFADADAESEDCDD